MPIFINGIGRLGFAKARQAAIIQVQTDLLQPPKPVKNRITVEEVYAEYCKTGRCGKAYGTTRKQDSLWKEHLWVDFPRGNGLEFFRISP